MPAVPTTSPATGDPVPPYYIHTTAGHFVDTSGRTLLLRGVNLSGDNKYPIGHNSYTLDGFWESGETGNVSFVGRPFPLEEAGVHLERLRGWGMNFIRYVLCWEALEHAGPKQYDEEFIDYTIALLRKCKEFGFKVYIDPHQDVWSRWSGGSGAPFWTLHACGLEPRNFTATGGLIHNEYPDPKSPDPNKFPPMAWPTSYFRLPSMTLFTMFFGGRDFAPKCIIDGMNIQDYLQSHFIDAFTHLADRLREAGGLLDECVIAWESMNEPSEGFITLDDLTNFHEEQQLKIESCPTPAQALRLGSGMAQTVDFWTFKSTGPTKTGTVLVDPKGASVWLDQKHEPGSVSIKWGWQRDPGWKLGVCPWEQHGLWDKESGTMKILDYFKWSRNSESKRKIDFVAEYWLPFWKSWSQSIRKAHPEAIVFIQPPLFKPPPNMSESDMKGRVAYSPHFYDGLTMITRHWNWFNSSTIHVLRKRIHIIQSFKVGDESIKKNFQEQLALFREDVNENVGAYPVVLGETGTPFDVDSKRSYGMTHGGVYIGNHVQQQKALDASLGATDGSNVYNYTIWAYNSTHSWENGDGFNGEDLSIWSPDDHTYRRHVKFERLAKAAAEGKLPSVSIGSAEVPPDELEVDETAPVPPDEMEVKPVPLPSLLKSREAKNFEFLVDGARALGAFSRPYPIKTVGRPKHLSYNILQATFSMTVSVEPSDAPPEGLLERTGFKEKGLPTEIYLPLTTFSSPPTLFPVPTAEEGAEELLASRSGRSTPNKSRPSTPSPPHGKKKIGSRTPKQNLKELTKRSHSIQDAISRMHFAFAGDKSKVAAGYALHLSSDPPLPLQIPDDVLDIDVEVSGGSWELRGQTLLWYYPVPNEGTKTYTIKIKKRDPRPGSPSKAGKDEGCAIM
ncbi:hypothetical protein M407DRAFT_227596 [Tulasnella calospora MUT 4182]|uniref:Glycoside hydrolase family 5 protein n=1 Tax=Tulasnella calospora MUT 4182 TaxID=1051891 RepID=A0A0C3M727_9AGAM|nr:hypothetical protein M407DRAFT_227596 [Tulasnella calospora MUT 4182]